MQHFVPTSLATSVALALALCAAPPSASAHEPAARVGGVLPTASLDPHTLDARPVLFDERGDGSTWALGSTWKACFDANGATYLPRVGAAVQRSQSHVLSPDSVTIGGETLTFDRSARAIRHADRVEWDRGAFVESYDLAPSSVEQSFTFAKSPGAGDLVLHVPVGVDGVETDDGIELRSEGARVSYSRAVVVDASGRRTPVDTHCADGAITIRVAAGVLASAAWPIVVDPVVSSITVPATTLDEVSSDAAFDASSGVWMVVWEQVNSAIDHDVLACQYSSTGTPLGVSQVEIGPQSWSRPRVANLASAHAFLIVAGETTTTGLRRVMGRIAQPSGAQGPEIVISAGAGGSNILPDVGGDSSPTSPRWCVVYEHDFPGNDKKISFVLVDANGAIPITTFTASGVDYTAPSISNSNEGTSWLLTWQAQGTIGLADIVGARVLPSGLTLSFPFTIAGSSQNEATAVASSPIAGTSRYAVTYVKGLGGLGGVRTVMAALLDGSTVLQTADIRTLEGNTILNDQFEPSIDSDGEHFLVAYSENVGGAAAAVFATDLAVVGDTLEAVQPHVPAQPGLVPDTRRCSVAAAPAGGALDHRYLVTFDWGGVTTEHDVTGRFFDGFAGGSTRSSCPGDGSASPCPCGNNGSAGHGCGNSVNPAGAVLTVTGTPSTLSDSLVLHVSGVPATSTCTFFQGTASIASAVFGDGLMCTGGSILRLRTVAASGGVAVFPGPTDPSVSVRGQVPADGGTRTYQVSYRNAAAFCTSATFNITNGVIVDWAR